MGPPVITKSDVSDVALNAGISKTKVFCNRLHSGVGNSRTIALASLSHRDALSIRGADTLIVRSSHDQNARYSRKEPARMMADWAEV